MYGTLYLIPCPISDETAPWDVLPAANRAVMDSLDYFIVENTRPATVCSFSSRKQSVSIGRAAPAFDRNRRAVRVFSTIK